MMKARIAIAGAVMLVLASFGPCFGMMSVAPLSRQQAEQMGIEIRSKALGVQGLFVEIEFKLEGKLRLFDPELASRVELRFTDGAESSPDGGKAVIHAPLQLEQPGPGRMQAGFTTSRDQVERLSVMIVLGAGLLPEGAYEIDLKEFVQGAPTPASGKDADAHEELRRLSI
jgi:hypothetical protein